MAADIGTESLLNTARRKVVGWLRPTASSVEDRDCPTVKEEIFDGHGGIVVYDRDSGEIAQEDHERMFLGEVQTVVVERTGKYRFDFAFRNWLADLIEPPETNLELVAIVNAVARGDIKYETMMEIRKSQGADTSNPPPWIEPETNPELVAIAKAVARGDIKFEPMIPPPRILGELNTPYIEVQTSKRKRLRRTKGIRIPVLAGEVARLTQQRLGKLPRTSENTALVYHDISRRVEALSKSKDERFMTMHSKELLCVTRWASELFWVQPSAEEDIDGRMDLEEWCVACATK